MAALPTTAAPLVNSLAGDTRSIAQLKQQAASDPKSAIRQAAQQFESLFMHELMKGMRQSSLNTGLLDNEGSKLGTEMLDTEFASRMSGQPGGLADVIARQLERQMGVPAATQLPQRAATVSALRAGVVDTPQARKAASGAQAFVAEHQDAARAVEAKTGIPAGFLIAQAAHETGWGKRDIRLADGSPSHNLFGIKAGANWKGPVAEITTTEYIGGQAVKVKAKFRAYASAEESFADYAKLIANNPRYERALASANAGDAKQFAWGLQRAGYATDPAYADKLSRVINTTLRLQRAMT